MGADVITLLGATGYTGRLVAQALSRLELPFRLAGRSPERLAALSEALPGAPSWLVADATQPDTLLPLFEGSHVLVNCAGPFTDLGEPVVAQAALHGVRYLDTANELGYVYRVQGYDALAQRSGAAIVPACGFEVALADSAAELLFRDHYPSPEQGEPVPLDEISIVYDIRGRGSSFGSRRSAVRSLATSWLGYWQGQWSQAIPGREGRRVQLPDGPRPALSFPSSEIVTVPGHVPVRQVTTWLTVSWHALFWAPVLIPIFAWLARGPVGRLVEAVISRAFPPPEGGLRSDASFVVRVEARRDGVCRSLTLSGKGVYDLTGEIAAYAAGQMAQPDFDRAGVLAPAAALDPRALLDHAVDHWEITARREL
jgi:short subunit dehydrogenase-like uncharacterized protein